MSDNRAQDWLDDAAAERLLRGEGGDRRPSGDGREDDVFRDPRAEALTRLLSAAAAPAPLDAGREEMAVAAFRAARDEGRLTHGRPHRIADDWRRRGGALRSGRSVRALSGALLATVALGGVAVAAVTGTLTAPFNPLGQASAGHSAPADGATSGASASDRPDQQSPAGGATSGVPTPNVSPAPSGAARGQALCQAWAEAARRNQSMDARAYERLVADAGGRKKVRGYCAGVLGVDVKTGVDGKSAGTGKNDSGESGGKGDKGDKGDDGSDGKRKADGTAHRTNGNGESDRSGHARGDGKRRSDGVNAQATKAAKGTGSGKNTGHNGDAKQEN